MRNDGIFLWYHIHTLTISRWRCCCCCCCWGCLGSRCCCFLLARSTSRCCFLLARRASCWCLFLRRCCCRCGYHCTHTKCNCTCNNEYVSKRMLHRPKQWSQWPRQLQLANLRTGKNGLLWWRIQRECATMSVTASLRCQRLRSNVITCNSVIGLCSCCWWSTKQCITRHSNDGIENWVANAMGLAISWA